MAVLYRIPGEKASRETEKSNLDNIFWLRPENAHVAPATFPPPLTIDYFLI